MITAFSRIIKAGVQTFRRNAWLSAATIAIMALTLFAFSNVVVFRFFTRQVVSVIQDKIDVSLYFDTSIDEGEIIRVRDIIRQLPEVSSVDYVSREQALEEFRARHKENPVLTQALEELGSNPLQASLNIKARETSQYAAIISFINQAPFKDSIAKLNFAENQIVIERLNRIIRGANRAGVILSLALALIASLIFFNTIRMAIYSFREEVGIMKLVGASNWFARGPFVVMGILASIIASFVALIVFWPVIATISPKVASFVPGVDVYGFFKANLLGIFLLQTAVGVFLGVFSSVVALNKYLKV